MSIYCLSSSGHSSHLALPSLPQNSEWVGGYQGEGATLTAFPSVPSPCLALSQSLFFRVPAPSLLLLFLRLGEAIFHQLLQYYNTSKRLSLGSLSALMQDSLWLGHVSEASSLRLTPLCPHTHGYHLVQSFRPGESLAGVCGETFCTVTQWFGFQLHVGN